MKLKEERFHSEVYRGNEGKSEDAASAPDGNDLLSHGLPQDVPKRKSDWLSVLKSFLRSFRTRIGEEQTPDFTNMGNTDFSEPNWHGHWQSTKWL